MSLTLSSIRDGMEGLVPAVLATCSAQGEPNVSYLSDVYYVDESHLALSFQFFSKTRRNILENPYARLELVDPINSARYRLLLQYLRTETSGAMFEHMRARLAGIASQSGMTNVFVLRGSDVYRVLAIEEVERLQSGAPPRRALLPALREVSAALSDQSDLATLLESALAALEKHFDITNAMVLLRDPGADKLFTVASRGYERSGVGSEVALGQGIIGTAAQAGVPIRIGSMQVEALYSRAIREGLLAAGRLADLEAEIPLPGLARPHSQMAVPIPIAGSVAGVLFVESAEAARFRYDDEDALVVLGRQLGLAIRLVTEQAETTEDAPAVQPAPARPQGTGLGTEPGTELKVRFFREQSTVFLGDDYLIKGVAGAIVWKLLREYAEHGRTSFTSRELRLDAAIGLPDLCDNLAARLILLERRLEERAAGISLSRTGRGRVELQVHRPLILLEGQAP